MKNLWIVQCTFILCLNSLGLIAQTITDKIDAYMASYMANNDFAGTILIKKGDETVFEKAYGLADKAQNIPNNITTQYRISSITKTFTATMIILCKEKGLLDFADPVSKFIPDYPQGSKIKIEHLLNHESGIPDYNSFADYDQMMASKNSLEKMVAWFKDKPLKFKPGKDGEYSNSNYNLLAYILEIITKKSYEENLKELIINKLNLNHTALDTKDLPKENKAKGYSPLFSQDIKEATDYYIENKMGSGNIISNVQDIYLWTKSIFSSQFYNIKEITPYGWAARNYFKRQLVEQDGMSPGFISYTSYYPSENLYIIYLGNIEGLGFRKLRLDLAAIYFNEPYSAPPIRTQTIHNQELLSTISGQYVFSAQYKFIIKKEGEKLYFNWLNRKNIEELLPISENEITLRSSGVILTLQNKGTQNQNIKWFESGYIAICKKEK